MFIFTGQQKQEEQQQQPDPRLLLSLPGPALRRVLQLASTPASPALCHLCCVSKGLRAAAEAAQAPVRLVLHRPHFRWPFCVMCSATHLDSLGAWVRRQVHCVRGLSVEDRDNYCSLHWSQDSRNGPHGMLQALVLGPPDELAAGALCQSTTTTPTAPPWQWGVQGGHNTVLEELHIKINSYRPTLISAPAHFQGLRVLVMRGWVSYMPGSATAATEQLLQMLPKLTRLQKFALVPGRTSPECSPDDLMRSLPPSLQALDLRLRKHPTSGASTCSSCSMVHLVHLTSLKLRGVTLVYNDTPPGAPRQQQQQQQQGATSALVSVLGQQMQQQLSKMSLREQQPLPWQRACTLKAMSLRPRLSNSWFAAPSLETLELILGAEPHPDLAQLARCPQLRQLSLRYRGRLPQHTGVSAVTQVTQLTLHANKVTSTSGSNSRSSSNSGSSTTTTTSSSSSLGAELAALEQLQVLGVSYAILKAAPLQAWVPVLVGHLTQLLVVVRQEECSNLQALSHLAQLLKEAPSVTSTSSSSACEGSQGATPGDVNSSSSSNHAGVSSQEGTLEYTSSSAACGGSQTATPGNTSSNTASQSSPDAASLPNSSSSYAGRQAVPTRLRCVQLMLAGRDSCSWRPGFQAAMAASMLQWEAALPGLRVTCVRDSYTCPCWTAAAAEHQVGHG